MSYKFLLFDLDHTLLDFDKAEGIALTQFLSQEGVEDIQAYKDYYVPMNKALWKDLEQRKISKEQLINTRFARLFSHFGIKKDGTVLAQSYQSYIAQQGQVFPGVNELLDSLISRGYELYAATNGVTAIQNGRLKKSGLLPYFKQVFISEQMQTQKPDSLFFEKIGKQIEGFTKEKAVIIGDSLTADIQGGNNTGIDTIWYNPHHLENKSQAQPTYEVDSYQALLDCLNLF